MLKILVLAPKIPYPPHDGFSVRVWNLYRRLALRFDLTLWCLGAAEVEAPAGPDRFGLRIVTPGRNTGGSLLVRIKKLSHLFGPYPVWTAALRFGSADRLLRRLEAEKRFDVVILESSWMGVYWPVVRHFKGRKVLDLHDLEGEKIARQAALMKAGPEKLNHRFNAWQFQRLEQRLVPSVDGVFVPSERELTRLGRLGSRSRIQVAPNGVDCVGILPLPVSDRGRDLLFVGNLGYFSNRDGIEHFVDTVLPRVRDAFPDVQLWIVGKDPPEDIRALADRPGIRVTGEVDDLRPYYQRCVVAVVPLRAGSGTRLKILEAMAYGRPVVSTALGCEGIGGVPGRHLLVADSSAAFAAAVIELLRNPSLARELAENGRRLVEERFAWDVVAQRMGDQLQAMVR